MFIKYQMDWRYSADKSEIYEQIFRHLFIEPVPVAHKGNIFIGCFNDNKVQQ